MTCLKAHAAFHIRDENSETGTPLPKLNIENTQLRLEYICSHMHKFMVDDISMSCGTRGLFGDDIHSEDDP